MYDEGKDMPEGEKTAPITIESIKDLLRQELADVVRQKDLEHVLSAFVTEERMNRHLMVLEARSEKQQAQIDTHSVALAKIDAVVERIDAKLTGIKESLDLRHRELDGIHQRQTEHERNLDELQDNVTDVRIAQSELLSKHNEFKADVFGSDSPTGSKSFRELMQEQFCEMNKTIESLTQALTGQYQQMATAQAAVALQVEQNRQFIQNRKSIEQKIVGIVPNLLRAGWEVVKAHPRLAGAISGLLAGTGLYDFLRSLFMR